jgi:hypothetical protein
LLDSFVNIAVAQYWVPCPHLDLTVSSWSSWFSCDAVPCSVTSPGSSCRELAFSTEYYPIVTRPRPSTNADQPRAPSMGFCSSSRQFMESTDNELPTARLTVRPQRFSRSRRLTPPQTSWACFIPQPRSGFTLQGVSPLLSRLTFRPLVPS